MKSIIAVIAESLAATVIVATCFMAQGIIGAPSWSLPVFIIPTILYLNWRLKSNWSYSEMLLFVLGIGFVIFVGEFLPVAWRPVLYGVGGLVMARQLGRSSSTFQPKNTSHQSDG